MYKPNPIPPPRTTKKGYEEVHVPALKPPAMKSGEALREISALPDWARPAFGGMKSLNRLQSAVCDAALFTGENMLICAPTGAGKTNVAVLCILHQLGLHRGADGEIDKSAFKIVYIAPMKVGFWYWSVGWLFGRLRRLVRVVKMVGWVRLWVCIHLILILLAPHPCLDTTLNTRALNIPPPSGPRRRDGRQLHQAPD